MGKLDNKVAIVTGGGTGIGYKIAMTFAGEGADVVVCGPMSALEGVTEEIRALGRKSLAIAVDVSNREQVRKMAEQVLEAFGTIDILVNNAGISFRRHIIDMTEEEWDAVMNTNLKGTFFCMQAVAGHMMERKYGKIVNISSIVAIRPSAEGVSVYGASKAGVDQLTKSGALEFSRFGININAIAPGNVNTSIFRKIMNDEQIEEWMTAAKNSPIGRLADPQEIANVALFLASEESSFICGETIVVDGGRNAKMA